jgi:hypothetical protein
MDKAGGLIEPEPSGADGPGFACRRGLNGLQSSGATGQGNIIADERNRYLSRKRGLQCRKTA